MKQKLESELVSIAYRILKLSGNEDVVKLQAEAGALYQALTVLKFAEENFDGKLPVIGSDSSFFGMLDTPPISKAKKPVKIKEKEEVRLVETKSEEIKEPVANEAKVILQNIPETLKNMDAVFEETPPKKVIIKNDFEDITEGFKEMPIFEPISNTGAPKKSLNDKLKFGAFNIGLNDKIAFIKHLFDGESEDYNRVISQLNTLDSLENTREFIQGMVKPDYNNWSGKEEIEERFIEIIEAKFD